MLTSALGSLFGVAQEPWVKAVENTKFRSADREEMKKLFDYLRFCLEQVLIKYNCWLVLSNAL